MMNTIKRIALKGNYLEVELPIGIVILDVWWEHTESNDCAGMDYLCFPNSRKVIYQFRFVTSGENVPTDYSFGHRVIGTGGPYSKYLFFKIKNPL